MGGWMDDAGAAIALSAVRHVRYRQRSCNKSGRRALVSAVEIRTLARRQLTLISSACAAMNHSNALPQPGNGNIVLRVSLVSSPQGGRQQCAGTFNPVATIHGRSTCW